MKPHPHGPRDPATLAPSEKEKVESWFRQLGVAACCACGNQGRDWWTVGSHMVFLPTFVPQESRAAYPGIVIMCRHCWRIDVYHASAAGISREVP